MLKHLQYKVEFDKPARTLENVMSFDSGLTAITGANGNGKSMILEMIQFLMFGNAALRGKADDYKSIEGNLRFIVKGETWIVTRSKTKAILMQVFHHEDGSSFSETKASGTKPVNAKIKELFGYSYDVFKVANVANQGKIEELGDKKPTERKQLVDETVGLNVLDDLSSFIDDERKRLSSGIKAVESFLVVPQQPENPNLEFDSATYAAQRKELYELQNIRNLLAAVANKALAEPVRVSLLDDDAQLDNYKIEQGIRTRLMTEFQLLTQQLKAIPKTPSTMVDKLEEDDHLYEGYTADHKKAVDLTSELRFKIGELTRLSWREATPLMTEEESAAAIALNTAIERWVDKMKLKKTAVPHDCPKCNHHWEDADPRLLTEFKDVPDQRPYGEKTAYNVIALHQQGRTNLEHRLVHLERIEEIEAELKVLYKEKLAENIARIEATRKAYQESNVERANAVRRIEMENRCTEVSWGFDSTIDRAPRIVEIEKNRSAVQLSNMMIANYEVALAEKLAAQKQLDSMNPNLDTLVEAVDKNYVFAVTYENNMVHYAKAVEAYDKAIVTLNALKSELEDWENGRAAIADLRVKVKGYLLPSLNAVASSLINDMTNGELSWIVVNDQFEITVEGQRLETLSGAGKAVANLALRIGLGQVLTNRVFSVMMLDEADAGCDDDRARYVANCLKNLTKTINQVVVVSHKQGIVADHYLRM